MVVPVAPLRSHSHSRGRFDLKTPEGPEFTECFAGKGSGFLDGLADEWHQWIGRGGDASTQAEWTTRHVGRSYRSWLCLLERSRLR
ncbi:hypothetical protein HPB47_023991 [Ixodes persulcatus]|uniref:Uncharacterized protein n=1 Tax=Ixodes persulcatus TaxID=34615 RepID=A0AC60Q5G2_IXOPE|nr:hypothetical protein HPB47_023991 [Ixodes persulcatus]